MENGLRNDKLHSSWAENQWQKVVWSDESKFEICSLYVHRSSGERYISVYSHLYIMVEAAS